MTEPIGVRLARLDERMKALDGHMAHIRRQLDRMSHLQVIIDRNNQAMPEVKAALIGAQSDIHRINRRIASVRWFFMGAGAAFGLLGGMVSENIRALLRLLHVS